MSGVELNKRSMRTVPKNPVPPVTKIFLPAKKLEIVLRSSLTAELSLAMHISAIVNSVHLTRLKRNNFWPTLNFFSARIAILIPTLSFSTPTRTKQSYPMLRFSIVFSLCVAVFFLWWEHRSFFFFVFWPTTGFHV